MNRAPTLRRPTPLALMVSSEATFEAFGDRAHGGVILVMRPHGVERGSDDEVGWCLSWDEVRGLARLLIEAAGDDE